MTANTFRITLPNRNTVQTGQARNPERQKLTPQMLTVQEHIRSNGPVSFEQIQSLLGVKKTRAYDLIRQMLELGVIVGRGRGNGKKYSLD